MHVECDFKAVRGITSLCRQLATQFGRDAHYEFFLDFFFLINTYYWSRYGINWTSHKIPIIKSILPNSTIILPEDTAHSVRKMLDKHGLPHRRLTIQEAAHNPFVSLTFRPNVTQGLAKDHRLEAREQLREYITGFYRF